MSLGEWKTTPIRIAQIRQRCDLCGREFEIDGYNGNHLDRLDRALSYAMAEHAKRDHPDTTATRALDTEENP